MEKNWIESYEAGVPHEIDPDKYSSLVELFEQSCQQFADKPAFSNLGTTLTYRELEEKTRHFASYLQNTLKLNKGERVALMFPNLLQYPIALFGALRAGCVIVNVNPLYTPDELTHQLNDSGAQTILVLANFANTVEKALPNTQLKNIIVTEIGDCLPWVKKTLVNFVVKHVKKMVPSYHLPGCLHFNQVLSEGQQTEFKPVNLEKTDIAFLQYTGGTTGVAKGAILTHRNMVANLEQASAWFSSILETGAETIVTALPLYHIFSLTANCLTFMKIGSHNLLITNPRDIPNFIKEISSAKFTAITGVNTLFNALLHHPNFSKIDFSQLKLALAGGMALQKTVAEKWMKLTGKPVLEAFGMTETSPAVTINPVGMDIFNGSIGLPISSTEVKVIDDDGNELPLGESGELCVRGPQVMQGYWQRPDETAKVLDDSGWLKTGDIARIDDQGFVYLVDRKKDMILVSGFNVYPNEVEHVISTHPGVLEVGVVGENVEHSGERVVAYIVKKDPNLTKESVIAHCREHLTAYKVPKKINFRDELPKTNVGKILRRKLKDCA